MNLFPTLKSDLVSSKNSTEVYVSLKTITIRKQDYYGEDVDFFGTVDKQKFKIYPKISYRNSFLPIIEGVITDSENGSVIHVNMRLHRFVNVFVTIWSVLLLIILVSVLLFGNISGSGNILLFALIILGMLAFMQVLMRLCFYIPAKKALNKLREHLC